MPITRRDDGGRSAGAPLARIALALLVAATCAALLIAQQLKHQDALADAAVWQPSSGTFNPRASTATVDFMPHYSDRVSVSIVSTRTGRVVATIARGYAVSRGQRTKPFRWTGRSASGALEPAGTYVVDVHFDGLDRTTQLPQASFKLRPGPR